MSISKTAFTLLLTVCALGALSAEEFRIGIIGTTTSHVPAAVDAINSDNPAFEGFRVTAAYPGGIPDNPDSWGRVEKYADHCRQAGLTIYSTIEEMLPNVDGVMLESVDGRPHLEQAKPVLAAGKPLFIDKPISGCLFDCLELFRLADEAGVEIFSASSLRYGVETQRFRSEKPMGEILGVDAASPCSLNPHHPDFYWYGVHGVEILFTLMGPGCQSVSRTQTDGQEMAVGTWEGGRIGTFRGMRSVYNYNATVFCNDGIGSCGDYDGYEPLFVEVCRFFATGKSPVPAEETKEMFAFMSAADQSKALGGLPVKLSDCIENALSQKRVTVEVVFAQDGSFTWDGQPSSIEDAQGRLQAAGGDTVTRVIVNNRAGAPVERVQELMGKLDGAYFANYLY